MSKSKIRKTQEDSTPASTLETNQQVIEGEPLSESEELEFEIYQKLVRERPERIEKAAEHLLTINALLIGASQFAFEKVLSASLQTRLLLFLTTLCLGCGLLLAMRVVVPSFVRPDTFSDFSDWYHTTLNRRSRLTQIGYGFLAFATFILSLAFMSG
jgi:hypothetical protein